MGSNNKSITTDGCLYGDGIGSQLQNYLATYALSKAIGRSFFYSPLRHCGHANSTQIKNYNDFLHSLFIQFFSENIDNKDCLKVVDLKSNSPCLTFLKSYKSKIMLVRGADAVLDWDTSYANEALTPLRLRLEKIIEDFISPCEKLILQELKDSVVIHVRRGDVNKDMTPRWVSNKFYIDFVKNLYDSNPQQKIVILSETKGFSLRLENDDIVLLLDQSFFVTLWLAVNCKLFVTSKSSYSYSAALLCPPEKVLYMPFWHAPLPGWNIITHPSIFNTSSYVNIDSKPKDRISLIFYFFTIKKIYSLLIRLLKNG